MTYGGAGANDQQFRRAPKLPSNAMGVAGFYSTQDAASEGEEGKFFVCSPDEIRKVLADDADQFMAAYGVTPNGDFEAPAPGGLGGNNILEFVGDLDQRPALAEARRALFEARDKRVRPCRDDVQLARLRQLPSNAADPVGHIAAVPLLQDRGLVDGEAAAYVCDAPAPGRAFACQAPVTKPEALRAQLKQR